MTHAVTASAAILPADASYATATARAVDAAFTTA